MLQIGKPSVVCTTPCLIAKIFGQEVSQTSPRLEQQEHVKASFAGILFEAGDDWANETRHAPSGCSKELLSHFPMLGMAIRERSRTDILQTG